MKSLLRIIVAVLLLASMPLLPGCGAGVGVPEVRAPQTSGGNNRQRELAEDALRDQQEAAQQGQAQGQQQ